MNEKELKEEKEKLFYEHMHAETQKFLAHNAKFMAETVLLKKKATWYELTIALALGALIATLIAKY